MSKMVEEISTTDQRRIVKVPGLATYLKVSHHTIYDWVERAKMGCENPIPFHRSGRLLRFDLDEIDRWTTREREPIPTAGFRGTMQSR